MIQKTYGKKILCFLLILLTLTACGSKKQGPPEDTPWNHGLRAIMETEKGYYSNTNYTQCLRYYEKDTDVTILLCNKPECSHQKTDFCEATYKNMRVVNTVLYDGFLYVLGIEGAENDEGVFQQQQDTGETSIVNVALWRGALDGSSFDLVGTVASEENIKKETVNMGGSVQNQDQSFIIHKGFAYIPYYVQFGRGQMGLRCGGLCRMDLKTGQTQQLYNVESKMFTVPYNLTGVGDYVYFRGSSGSRAQSVMRYVISKDEVETVWEYGSQNVDPTFELYSKDRIYLFTMYPEDENKERACGFRVLDAKTLKELPQEEIITQVSFKKKITEHNFEKVGPFLKMLLYDEKLYLASEEGLQIYDLKGNLLTSLEGPKEYLEGNLNLGFILDYAINNERLYAMVHNNAAEYDGSVYNVLYCPLEEVLQGKETWQKAFDVQGLRTIVELQELLNKGSVIIRESESSEE